MAKLRPYPFDLLVRRVFDEWRGNRSILGLSEKQLFSGVEGRSFAIDLHGRRVGSPLGPAAGPHTQMAQNIVAAWAAGAHSFELKTVQVRDALEIPRPCIDMRTVGYNVEWSQELRLEESFEEYVKGAVLIGMLGASGVPGDGREVDTLRGPSTGAAGSTAASESLCLFDMSVGYDLAGIQATPVRRFIEGMKDAGAMIDRLRAAIPRELRAPGTGALRDLEFPPCISNSVTLSTFHGCPPEEIERIVEWLMLEHGLDCVVKFNPTLLGCAETEHLLYDVLGYHDVHTARDAFENEATWDEAVALSGRLSELAGRLDRHFGVKFTNTLVVENRAGFLPESERQAYLSGRPLHLLAMQLVARFRRHFEDRIPISFSAGIDRHNVADALALGLAPITVCSDLLAPGGYGRLSLYYREIARRMDAVGARDLEEFGRRAYQFGESVGEPAAGTSQDLSAAHCRNTERYLERLMSDARYTRRRNARGPRTVESRLSLFDCLNCDICITVCPNVANFAFDLPSSEYRRVKLVRRGLTWQWCEDDPVHLKGTSQIGNFADFCNDCGNCEVFCPEDGAPFLVKPRFFGSEAAWREDGGQGFFVSRGRSCDRIQARHEGRVYRLEWSGDGVCWSGPKFTVSFDIGDPRGTVAAEGPAEIDLTPCFMIDAVGRAVLDTERVNHVSVLARARTEGEKTA